MSEAVTVAQWSPEQRAVAVALLQAGGKLADVHRRTGVPKPTLSRWAAEADVEPAGAEQVAAAVAATRLAWTQRRATLIDEAGDAAAEFVRRALQAEDAVQGQKWMTAFAIGVDKAQLLSGGVTSRHEQLDAQRRRERVEALQDELAERRAVKDGTTGG